MQRVSRIRHARAAAAAAGPGPASVIAMYENSFTF